MAGDVAHRARRRLSRTWARIRGQAPAPEHYYGDPAAYWEQRHQQFDDQLDGIGTKGLGESANREDYEAKWEHLAATLAALDLDGVAVLDAGCGIGWFTEKLLAQGHELTAVDFSASAVEIARRRLGDRVHVEVGRLDQYDSGRTFPLVVCIDVLFHIVDDAEWQATLANLATQVADRGTFVVQDHLVDAPAEVVVDTTTTHTRWRSAGMYERALDGWELQWVDHYRLPREGQTKDLMVFRRR